jgi:hypothetical protein
MFYCCRGDSSGLEVNGPKCGGSQSAAHGAPLLSYYCLPDDGFIFVKTSFRFQNIEAHLHVVFMYSSCAQV